MEEVERKMKTNQPEEGEVLIQKLPSDMGIHRNSRKGTLDAPETVLKGLEFEEKVFVDEVFPDEFDLEETHRRIEKNTAELLEYGKPIFSLGGDHSVSFPVLKALKQKFPNLKLVWLDAHLDLKEKVNGHVSHDVVVRELLNSGFSEQDIIFAGITEVDHDEEKFLDEHDFTIYHPGGLSELIKTGQFEAPIYLSVDIDVLTPEEAPGTGYRDGSLTLEQVLKVIESVSPDYADLVEVAPSLDEEETTVKNSRKITKKLLEQLKK